MIATRSTYAPSNGERIATWEPLYRVFRNFPAGQAQQDGPSTAAACPAPSTANARLGGQENSK